MKLHLLKLKRSTRRLLASTALFIIIALLSQSRESTHLETILTRGTVNFITRPGPVTYYEDAKGKNGLEYLLAKDFADYLGVTLVITSTDSLGQLFNMLGGPNGDFAGATLTITDSRLKKYLFSEPYSNVVQVVIYQRGKPKPTSVSDLIGKSIAVVKDSSHEEHLQELKHQHPDLSWTSIEGLEMIELMEMVNEGQIDYAIIDSTTFRAHKTIYPKTVTAFEISKSQKLAWAFPKRGDDSLLAAADRFMENAHKTGRIKNLNSIFFKGIENFSIAGSQLFSARVKTRLPKYQDIFRDVAKTKNMDWHLLASIAYQESHWNPRAVSPTGVRGMMMLTRQAASEVGVEDLHDPVESIRGGAQYFLNTKARMPDDITEPDRTWLALAAYNVGMGHLEDARVLTERAGKNPHIWKDVREFLPLLQKKKYYLVAKHGYARGLEPVNFVRNVRKYLRMLQWNTIEQNRRNQREESQLQPEPQKWNPDAFKTL